MTGIIQIRRTLPRVQARCPAELQMQLVASPRFEPHRRECVNKDALVGSRTMNELAEITVVNLGPIGDQNRPNTG